MPYIDNTDIASPYKVYATDMAGGLLNILISNGWSVAKTFKKATPLYSSESSSEFPPVVAYATSKHTIVRSPHGKFIGFGELGTTLTTEVTPNVIGKTHKTITPEQWALVRDSLDTIPFKSSSKVFQMYMLENEPTATEGKYLLVTKGLKMGKEGLEYTHHTDSTSATVVKEMQRTLMDVEYSDTGGTGVIVGSDFIFGNYGANSTIQENEVRAGIIKLYQADVRQSPTIAIDYFTRLGLVDDVYNTSNLWSDTEFSVQGRVDGDGFFFAVEGDTAVEPKDNIMANYPIFYGELVDSEGRQVSDCMFAGTMPSAATTDFTALAKATTSGFTPIAKSYPKNPSDGVNSVMVRRGRRGARYQAHYLSWGATPADMPPLRKTTDQKQYPKSWTDSVKNYGFQPSKYSNKVQTSYLYVVHPEEGVIGRIQNVVALQILTTSNPELRILREACPTKIRDSYKTTQISVVSPLTKRPSTAYPVMSLAIRKSVVEKAPSTNPAAVKDLAKETVDGFTTLSWTEVTDPFVDYFNIYNGSELTMPRVSDVSKVKVKGTGSFSVETVDIDGKKSTKVTV